MTLRREWILQTLSELERTALELAKYHQCTLASLQNDLSLRWTVERGLLAGLILIFNLADHVLSSVFHEQPETYEGLLDALSGHDVLSNHVRQNLQGAGGFRNVLVHEYAAIDLHEVAHMCREAPEIFRGFARDILAWLQTQVSQSEEEEST